MSYLHPSQTGTPAFSRRPGEPRLIKTLVSIPQTGTPAFSLGQCAFNHLVGDVSIPQTGTPAFSHGPVVKRGMGRRGFHPANGNSGL